MLRSHQTTPDTTTREKEEAGGERHTKISPFASREDQVRLLLQYYGMEHLRALAAAELGSRERTHGSVYVLREDVAVSEGRKGATSPSRSGGVSSPSSSTVVGERRDDDDDHDQAGLIIIDHDSQRLRSQAAAIPRVYGSQSTSPASMLSGKGQRLTWLTPPSSAK
jgi:hypothetical protein